MVSLALAGCGESAAEHRDVRGSRAASADAQVAAADADAELRSIIGYDCPGAPSSGSYGEFTVEVPARGYWTSTGLYLRPGEAAHFASSGTWTVWAGKAAPFDADGGETLTKVDGCRKGELVAKIGLGLNSKKTCVGKEADVVADEAGIVYLAMNDSASPTFHDGTLEVTVTSDADLAPRVAAKDAAHYDFCSLRSGWAEVETTGGLLLTVPAPLAAIQQRTLSASLAKLDRIYARAAALFGAAPFGGQPLRFFPDFAVRSRGWIVAGNPLLFDPKNLNAATPSDVKLLDLDAPGTRLFDFARAIGVDVSRSRGGRYQADDNMVQAFGGLVALYIEEEIPLGAWPQEICAGVAAQAASGTFATFAGDPWLQLCLLSELKRDFGWDLYARFFQGLPVDWSGVLDQGVTSLEAWQWIYAQLTAAAAKDLSATFARYHVPVP